MRTTLAMVGETAFNSISAKHFQHTLQQYSSIVPEKLIDLDEKRYNTIPNRLKLAKEAKTAVELTKDEVVTLVDWKLSHGKFRPALRGLVQQNDEATITETTRDAFLNYRGGVSTRTAIVALSKLKGIGPATASLLLSVYDPKGAPFFSDELFRWCMADEEASWDREIKYTLKEYLEMFRRVGQFQDRIMEYFKADVPAVDIEKVAYVLGKRGDSLETAIVVDSGEGGDTCNKRKGTATEDPMAKSSKKRKETSTASTKGVSSVSPSTINAAIEPPVRRSARNAR